MAFATTMGGEMGSDLGLGLGPEDYKKLFDQMQSWEGEGWSKFFVKITWGLASGYAGSFLINSSKARLFKVKSYMDADFDVRIDKNSVKAFTKDGIEIGDVLDDGLVKGKYSKRTFDPLKAGGVIKKLDWKNAVIDNNGLKIIKKHLSRFGASSQNSKAIKRIEDIIDGKIEVTAYDKRFYTHELREYERYQKLGIGDGVNDPDAWNHAHSATLEDYSINETKSPVYHPDTEPTIDDLLNEY
ncbi:MAG: hypothetical protein MI921_10990 [Cytophagales bacterium]|nr:hypothetical protein [Cytophagales bacterium]